jgi:hypothetical protein
VTREASVQFADPMLFRVIRVHDWLTYDGWAWLDGYELNAAGEAVDRRSIYVRLDGLRPVPAAPGRLTAPAQARPTVRLQSRGSRPVGAARPVATVGAARR